MSTSVYVYKCTSVSTSVSVCEYKCVSVRVCTCMYECVSSSVCVYICVSTSKYVCVCQWVRVYDYKGVRVHMCVRVITSVHECASVWVTSVRVCEYECV